MTGASLFSGPALKSRGGACGPRPFCCLPREPSREAAAEQRGSAAGGRSLGGQPPIVSGGGRPGERQMSQAAVVPANGNFRGRRLPRRQDVPAGGCLGGRMSRPMTGAAGPPHRPAAPPPRLRHHFRPASRHRRERFGFLPNGRTCRCDPSSRYGRPLPPPRLQ